MAVHSDSLSDEFLSSLRASLAEEFRGCRTICVKLHFGEPGNKTSLTPDQVRPFTDVLSSLGFSFFLYDTCVAYPGTRSHPDSHKEYAESKGWGRLGRVVIDGGFTPVKGEYLTYEVGRPLGDADGVLVISHVKGHVCSGFGGAIKNLGMGALSKESKRAIHDGGKPSEEGDCIACGACVAACPLHGIVLEEKPHIKRCFGCSNCGYACPTGYLRPRVAGFDALLADGAVAAERTFRRAYYVNVVNNVTRLCDCMASPGGIIAGDCGFVHGRSMAGVDRLSREVLLERTGRDVFLEHNLKSGLLQVEVAEKLLGS